MSGPWPPAPQTVATALFRRRSGRRSAACPRTYQRSRKESRMDAEHGMNHGVALMAGVDVRLTYHFDERLAESGSAPLA